MFSGLQPLAPMMRPPFVSAGGGGLSVDDSATFTSTGSTSYAVTLPTYSSGDLLVFFGVVGGNDNWDGTAPSGWTTLDNTLSITESIVLYRISDGTEGSTVTLSGINSATTHLSVVTLAVSGYDATTPIEAGTAATGSTDPPSLTPSWGSAENIWIAAGFSRRDPTYSAAPTNYSGLVQISAGDSSNAGSGVAVAFRTLTATSEDPGAWSVTGQNNPISNTYALQAA